eukprot:TRINITY_DN5520_c0_g1_i1.p1 TRINITY_DN5520_c0_g1~~TRINITY_DN5520_c0_g1_i1.p1  ORF type:complete len:299 (-),score=78.29 TRINITY_DN5520_c0_g1_i1:84-893(-)
MEGKVVVITGASGGIGAALAEAVARRGGRVVLAARRGDKLGEVRARCGGETTALSVVADVCRRADVERVRDEALAKFGHVDVWVNNVGRGISQNPSQLTDDDIDQTISVNVKSSLYGVQAILPHFRERGAGHIINVSSIMGRVPLLPQRAAYCAAKSALNSITACLRTELRASGLYPRIRASTVSPGPVATEFGINSLHGGFDSRAAPNAQSPEEVAEVIVDVILNPRDDVYTRPEYRNFIAGYYGAEDMDAYLHQAMAQMGSKKAPAK